LERVTISVDKGLLAEFDAYLARKEYSNRSEGIRDVLREFLASERLLADAQGPCIGCVTYVYNHKQRALSSRLVETQHHHHDVPAATLHFHIDRDNCLEATVLKGTVEEVRHLADQITSQTGVRHGKLHVIPLEAKRSRTP
jgi:CopG family transcriptional regulator, nickel-responsive regulator